jgi:E3 ubiquitin-protein ligase HERC4
MAVAAVTIAWTESGEVYSYGHNNAVGQLGRDSESTEDTAFLKITGLGGRKIVKVSCGGPPAVTEAMEDDHGYARYINTHCLALTDVGEVFAWGSSKNGQLGVASNSPFSVTPRLLEELLGGRVTDIAAGEGFSVVVRDGHLWAWGRKGGNGSPALDTYSPQPIAKEFSTNVPFVSIGASSKFAVALRADSALVCWGRLPCSDEDEEKLSPPVMVDPLLVQPHIPVQIAVGEAHCLCLTSEGKLLTFGENANGQLGIVLDENVDVFQRKDRVALLSNNPVLERIRFSVVRAMGMLSFAISHEGILYQWYARQLNVVLSHFSF